jgi:hypothetical protein
MMKTSINIFLSFLFSCSFAQYTLTFTLIDYNTRLPVANAMITCNNITEPTDGAGGASYVVPVAPCATCVAKYKYSITKYGYVPINDSVSIRSSRIVSILMKPIMYNIVFQISDGVKPFPGVSVNFNNQTILSDSANGRAIFVNVPMADSVMYTISKAGYKTITDYFDVNANSSYNFYMTKESTNIVKFIVKKNDSVNIENAKIVFNKDTVFTDVNGKAVFTNVPSEDALLYRIYKENYNMTSSVIDVSDMDITKIVMLDSLQVSFLVTNGFNNINEAEVKFYNRLQLTNDSGVTIFKNILSSKGYPYVVNKNGYKTYYGNTDVEEQNILVTVILIVSNQQGLMGNDINEIYIYPNPLVGDLYVNSTIKIKSLYIVDAMGHPIKTISNPTADLIMIDTEDMVNGIYVLKICDSNNREMTFKILKSNR